MKKTHQQLNFLISGKKTKQTSVLLKPTSIAEVSSERCTWRMDRRRSDARTTLDTCARAGSPRHSASPPTLTAAAVISRSFPYDADHRASRLASLTPLHGPHCRTPVPGPSPVTARSHRCDTHTPTALSSPLSVSWKSIIASRPANLDIDDSPSSASPTSFFVNMSRVYNVNAVNRLTHG